LPQSDVTIANPLRGWRRVAHRSPPPPPHPRLSRKYRPEITFLSGAGFPELEFRIAADLAARTWSLIERERERGGDGPPPRNEMGEGMERTRRRGSGERGCTRLA